MNSQSLLFLDRQLNQCVSLLLLHETIVSMLFWQHESYRLTLRKTKIIEKQKHVFHSFPRCVFFMALHSKKNVYK